METLLTHRGLCVEVADIQVPLANRGYERGKPNWMGVGHPTVEYGKDLSRGRLVNTTPLSSCFVWGKAAGTCIADYIFLNKDNSDATHGSLKMYDYPFRGRGQYIARKGILAISATTNGIMKPEVFIEKTGRTTILSMVRRVLQERPNWKVSRVYIYWFE